MYREPHLVREHNGQQFIDDFKKYREVLAYVHTTEYVFPVRLMDVWAAAKKRKINYYVTDTVFRHGRKVMVIY